MGNSFGIIYKGVSAGESAKLISSIAGYFYIMKVATTIVKPANGVLDVPLLTEECQRRCNNKTLIFISL